jgi:tRNA threonylcarbamoyladenosine biosynthesis protein TsaB
MAEAIERNYNLAIETSGPQGSVSLGRDEVLLGSDPIAPQKRANLELVPTIDQLCRTHNVHPGQLSQVYVSIGPGSFTGLRIAVATVKMLALAGDVKVVPVPTLAVLAANAPARVQHVAVGLNFKKNTMYSGIFKQSNNGWQLHSQAQLRTLDQLLAAAPRPVALLGDPLPTLPDVGHDQVEVLPAEYALARSEVVWQIGRDLAGQNQFADPAIIQPLYARQPEAVSLWDQRLAAGTTPTGS